MSHLDAALAYAHLGWHVVPACWPDAKGRCACPRGHQNDHEIGKAPWLKGYQDLRPTVDDVRTWWSRWPEANIAVLLRASGLVDVAPDSVAWWRRFQKNGLPRTAHATSGGGDGHLHYFYRRPQDTPLYRLCRPDEYDLLSEGIAILPPSRHQRGPRYGWLVAPEEMPSLPPVPLWALDMLRGAVRPPVERAAPLRVDAAPANGEPPVPLSGEAFERWQGTLIEATPSGQLDRSDSLFEIGRSLAKAGADESTVASAVAERDQALNWHKYSTRRDADRQYTEIAIRATTKPSPDLRIPERNGHVRTSESLLVDSNPRTFQPLSAADLFPDKPTPIPWIIAAPGELMTPSKLGLLADRNTAVLGADTGLGKTWIVADLVISLTTGGSLFGHFRITRKCRVMLIDEESSLWLLQSRWPQLLKGRGIPKEQFIEESMPNMRVYLDQGFSFDNDKALAVLHEEAKKFQPDIVLFDTLARVHRRPENDNSAIAALFEERIKPFARAHNTALFFAHHTRKPSKEGSNEPGALLRGASDIKAQLDQHWFLRGKANVPKVLFEHDKCRAAPAVPPFVLSREATDDGGIVIRYAAGEAIAHTAGGLAAGVVLELLIERGPSSRSQIAEHCRARGIGTRITDDALKQLYDQEQIGKTRDGKETIYAAVEAEL